MTQDYLLSFHGMSFLFLGVDLWSIKAFSFGGSPVQFKLLVPSLVLWCFTTHCLTQGPNVLEFRFFILEWSFACCVGYRTVVLLLVQCHLLQTWLLLRPCLIQLLVLAHMLRINSAQMCGLFRLSFVPLIFVSICGQYHSSDYNYVYGLSGFLRILRTLAPSSLAFPDQIENVFATVNKEAHGIS